MEKLNENERVTLTLLADTVKIEQGTLSNYISGRRNIPYDIACLLEKITGILSEVWLKASWKSKSEIGKKAYFTLRFKLGLIGLDSERRLASDVLRSRYNEYIDQLVFISN